VPAQRLDGRLRRLEGMTSVLGCPDCHQRRGRIWIRTSREQPDGTVIYREGDPLPCPAAGWCPNRFSTLSKSWWNRGKIWRGCTPSLRPSLTDEIRNETGVS
jgi:hypothetical protein